MTDAKTLAEQVKQRLTQAAKEADQRYGDHKLHVPEIMDSIAPILAAHEQREAEQAQALAAFTEYLRQDETPIECLLRHRSEADALLTLMAQDRFKLAEQAQEIESVWMVLRTAHYDKTHGTTANVVARIIEERRLQDQRNLDLLQECRQQAQEIERLKEEVAGSHFDENMAILERDAVKKELSDLRAKVEAFRQYGSNFTGDGRDTLHVWGALMDEFSRLFPERRSHDEPTR